MKDGVVLLADRYAARPPAGRQADEVESRPPTVLIRSPYGRTGVWGLAYGRSLAERGFQVIVQSVRGTFGSGGQFTPMRDERDDGLATVAWIRQQPWFGDRLASSGISYLGYVQWAIADDAGLDALCLQATTSSFADSTYDGAAFSLRLSLGWTGQVSRQGGRLGRLRSLAPPRELAQSLDHLPLRDGDQALLGKHVGFYQDWLTHGPDDEYWTSQSHTARVASVAVPVSMRTGWYDIFLPWMLRDYATLAAAGNPPRLTIGPWAHTSTGLFTGVARETVRFLSETLLDTPARTSKPVTYYVTGAGPGAGEWRDADTWPPAGVQEQVWSLAAKGELMFGAAASGPAPTGPATSGTAMSGTPAGPGAEPGTSAFRYDPADPTPSVAGPDLTDTDPSVDNRELEVRPDVLVFTSTRLRDPLEVTGTPRALITVSADNPYHDVFVRLCDVAPDGASLNVCDRLVRLDNVAPGPDGTRLAVLELWPTAHRFAAGHRIRVQVSGGAHPRYARNPGTGESLADAVRTVVSTVTVHHGISTITLPVSPR